MDGVCAVICEFDPLHAGHKRVIETAKNRSPVTLAILSGNFSQRSLPSLFDKYTRAEAAVRCGADLVVELPFPWSCAGAEYYAFGGVNLAMSLGADSFVFGSESGDINELESAAEYSMTSDFDDALKILSSNLTVGAAKLYDAAFSKGGFSLGKNDKLAVEYIKAARRSGRSDVSFNTIKRIPSSEKGHFSASEIRALISKNGIPSAKSLICPEAYEVFSSAVRSSQKRLEYLEFLFFRLFSEGEQDGIFEAQGGLGNRLRRIASSSATPEEFFSSASTKKYTDSRIRRAAIYSVLKVTKDDLKVRPPFSFVLAANEKGRKYLSDFADRNFTLITKPADGIKVAASRHFSLEQKADELYSLCTEPPSAAGIFMKHSPFMG